MRSSTIYTILTLIIMVLSGMAIFQTLEVNALNRKFVNLEANLAGMASSTGKQISELKDITSKQQQALLATKTPGVPTPQVTPPKTQDQLIRSAVAATAPSVASVVISASIPQLQISYVNPFGDDPNFGDIGIRIPVYKQSGSSIQKIGAGTGFLVSRNGYIVTNKHVVDKAGAQYTVLLSNGTQAQAQVVYRDDSQDVAVLKIPGTYNNFATLGDSSTVTLGQSVIAIGNALGEYSNSVSLGIVSGLNRTIKASDTSGNEEEIKGVMQIDAAINPGNSGGPLIDLNGKVVGITVATILGSNNIGFAIPINSVKGVIQAAIK